MARIIPITTQASPACLLVTMANTQRQRFRIPYAEYIDQT
jgi:hypothetical protein